MVQLTRKSFLQLSSAAAVAGCAATSGARAPWPQQPVRTLIKGADVLSMDPQIKEAPATDVLLENGRIAAIGKSLSAQADEVVDAQGMILMPGMVDGHRHVWEGTEAGRLVKTHPQGYARYQEWKMRTIVSMTEEDFYLSNYIGGLQALDSGVTTVLDYAHGQHTTEKALAAARGLQDSGVGGVYAYQLAHTTTYGPGDTIPLAQAEAQRGGSPEERHYRTAEMLRDQVFSDEGAPLKFGIALSGGYGRPMEAVKAEWDRARALGPNLLAAHIHRPDTPYAAGSFGARDSGIPDLQAAGLLGPDYHISHANQLTAEELAMLRDTGGMICSTAMGEFPYIASGRGPSVHGRARAAGVAVGIGIDVTIALNQDYFEHVRAAFWNLFLSEEGMRIASEYESEDVLDFATRLGARAMRLGDAAGQISVGRRADLVLLRTDRFGFASAGNLADRVVNFASLADIDSVWMAGVRRKKDGRMVGVDWDRLKAQMGAMQERVGRDAASITFT